MATKDITDAQVCRAVQAYQDTMEASGFTADCPYPYEALAIETGQAEKVCYRAMERAYRRQLIECGVSLRTGWLTDKGKALIL